MSRKKVAKKVAKNSFATNNRLKMMKKPMVRCHHLKKERVNEPDCKLVSLNEL